MTSEPKDYLLQWATVLHHFHPIAQAAMFFMDGFALVDHCFVSDTAGVGIVA